MNILDPDLTSSPPPPTRIGFWHRMRNYFLTGLVIASPIGITMYLAWLFVTTIDNYVTPFIPAKYNPETYLPFTLPGLGVVIVVVSLTLLGALTANFLGRILLSYGEKIFNGMPIVRGVYSTLKQIFETVISQNNNSFRDVVLIEYPRHGVWAIAFITGENTMDVQEKTDEEVVNLFLPTTPNPTSGFLLFAPKKDLIYLDMTPEEGVKYVISAGLVSPKTMKNRVTKPPSSE